MKERKDDNMQAADVDCSFCKNCRGFLCLIYGSDPEKSVRECAESGFKYFDKKLLNGTKYKCVESFRVGICHNGIPTGEYLFIEEGSIWIVKGVSSDFVGNISLAKDKTLEPLEITWGTLGVFFRKM